MKKILLLVSALMIIGLMSACGNNNNDSNNDLDELPELKVDFKVPETADPGDEVHLEAFVTYDENPVEEADEVLFEIWNIEDEENSEKIEAENEGDGTYTLDYTFDEEGIYEMYAHTTAEALHTMPKKQIIVGDAEAPEEDDEETAHFHTEGFDMHFDNPEQVKAEEEATLSTHIMLDDAALEDLNVRYEISLDNEQDTDWVDATEDDAGMYNATFTFEEQGTYVVTIHVEDDDDLHEHAEHEVTVD